MAERLGPESGDELWDSSESWVANVAGLVQVGQE